MLTLLAAPASPSRYIKNIYQKEDGQTINPSGIGVAVTTSGSMTKDRFPAFYAHFVKHLPGGQGKGGEPVILVFDGHSSRWNLDGLQFLREHNVHCLCIPGHTSIWAQPNDCGPNSSFKSMLGEAIAEWRSTRLTLPGSEALVKMDRGDFNGLFACMDAVERKGAKAVGGCGEQCNSERLEKYMPGSLQPRGAEVERCHRQVWPSGAARDATWARDRPKIGGLPPHVRGGGARAPFCGCSGGARAKWSHPAAPKRP